MIETPNKEKIEFLSKNGYKQVCIWPGTCVVNPPEGREPLADTPEGAVKMFEDFMQSTFNVRVKYLEEIKTLPDKLPSGAPDPETGNRNDLFFVINDEDIGKFAIPRLRYGIRWYEDVVSYNDHANLYPQEVLDRYEVRW